MTIEIDLTFRSIADWRNWHRSNPFIFDNAWADNLANRIARRGFVEPLTDIVAPPSEHLVARSQRREGFLHNGINARVRGVMHVMATTVDMTDISNLRIYAPEALTAFALKLRGIYPKFLGSEYTDDAEIKSSMYPIPFQDLHELDLPSNSFDLVSTNEVLEHVPFVDAALSELCRILRPGGWHIGTVPFAMMSETSIVKTRLVNGALEHLYEPEYHGNPMSNSGSLVFEIAGWDILERGLAAGFSEAVMRFVVSEKYGAMADDAGGIFVLCYRK